MTIKYNQRYIDKNGNKWLLEKIVRGRSLGLLKNYFLYGMINQDGQGAVMTDAIIKMIELKETS